jgi:hypothetical protein
MGVLVLYELYIEVDLWEKEGSLADTAAQEPMVSLRGDHKETTPCFEWVGRL